MKKYLPAWRLPPRFSPSCWMLSRVLKLSAIGKYPFITLDQNSFDFENLLVGKTATGEQLREGLAELFPLGGPGALQGLSHELFCR